MISVLIISKNEEDTIKGCILSVKSLASEIIVVDDSSDKTSQIAKSLGARVVRNKLEDFSKQRNLASSYAKFEWLYYIDADERATPEFIREVKDKLSLESNNANIGGFYVKRRTFFYNKDWHFTDRVQRIFRKSKLIGWTGIVHETPNVEGEMHEIKSPILHFTHRNLERMVEKTNDWSELEAELRLKAKHPKMNVIRFIRVVLTGFLKSYISEGGYRNGTAGFVEAFYQAFSMFITYSKLWEKQQKNVKSLL
jgi:glycosyltransferase involved in cell wall biosynthesis